jgi:hypothetical protein
MAQQYNTPLILAGVRVMLGLRQVEVIILPSQSLVIPLPMIFQPRLDRSSLLVLVMNLLLQFSLWKLKSRTTTPIPLVDQVKLRGLHYLTSVSVQPHKKPKEAPEIQSIPEREVSMFRFQIFQFQLSLEIWFFNAIIPLGLFICLLNL